MILPISVMFENGSRTSDEKRLHQMDLEAISQVEYGHWFCANILHPQILLCILRMQHTTFKQAKSEISGEHSLWGKCRAFSITKIPPPTPYHKQDPSPQSLSSSPFPSAGPLQPVSQYPSPSAGPPSPSAPPPLSICRTPSPSATSFIQPQ